MLKAVFSILVMIFVAEIYDLLVTELWQSSTSKMSPTSKVKCDVDIANLSFQSKN